MLMGLVLDDTLPYFLKKKKRMDVDWKYPTCPCPRCTSILYMQEMASARLQRHGLDFNDMDNAMLILLALYFIYSLKPCTLTEVAMRNMVVGVHFDMPSWNMLHIFCLLFRKTFWFLYYMLIMQLMYCIIWSCSSALELNFVVLLPVTKINLTIALNLINKLSAVDILNMMWQKSLTGLYFSTIAFFWVIKET